MQTLGKESQMAQMIAFDGIPVKTQKGLPRLSLQGPWLHGPRNIAPMRNGRTLPKTNVASLSRKQWPCQHEPYVKEDFGASFSRSRIIGLGPRPQPHSCHRVILMGRENLKNRPLPAAKGMTHLQGRRKSKLANPNPLNPPEPKL